MCYPFSMYMELELIDTPKGVFISSRSVLRLLEAEGNDWEKMDTDIAEAFENLTIRLRAAILTRENI